jgi:hypothetical protein
LAYEPAYTDELSVIARFALEHLQAPDGGSVYLRLSTRVLRQPRRELDAALREAVLRGGYWVEPPQPGARLAVVYAGAVAPEARAAFEQIRGEAPGSGLLAVTSADRLHAEWRAVRRGGAPGPSWIEQLLAPLGPSAQLVSVLDGHPATLSWLGSVARAGVVALGVDTFGQSGDIPDLYRTYGLDSDSIARACRAALADVGAVAAREAGGVVDSVAECDLGPALELCAHGRSRGSPVDLGLDALVLRAAALALADTARSAEPVDVALLQSGGHGPGLRLVRSADRRSAGEIAAELRASPAPEAAGERGPGARLVVSASGAPAAAASAPGAPAPAAAPCLFLEARPGRPARLRLRGAPPGTDSRALLEALCRRLEQPLGLLL